MQPIVNGLERQYGGALVFEYRNATETANQESLRAYGLRGHPSYVILDAEGQVRWSASGPLPEVVLRQQIEREISP